MFCQSQMCIHTSYMCVCLKAMRKGLLDVLPKNALEDLTAEDFRLLVNGCGEVNVQMLISFTSFNDESGKLLCPEPHALVPLVFLSHLSFLHSCRDERFTVVNYHSCT